VEIYRIARNGDVHEDKRNGGRGEGRFRVRPKSPIYSGMGDLGRNSTKRPDSSKYKNALNIQVDLANCSKNS
jgi:hypothetical protein